MNTIPTTNTGRLLSLDLMRGLIMVLLAFEAAGLYISLMNITSPDTWANSLMQQFFHNDWQGLHVWDLVQPAFMLMAGVAMAYSLTAQTRKGIPWSGQLRKILRRCAWLVFWGIIKRVYIPDWLHLKYLDVTDILTQLAFTTLIAFLLFRLSTRRLLLACAGILVLTELLYRSFHVPGQIEGYTMGMNSIFIYLFFSIVGCGWFNGYFTQLISPITSLFQHYSSLVPIINSLAIFVAEWCLCHFLYRKNIFFKL